MRDTLILSTACFPPIEYFSHLFQSSNIFVEANENFVKQTYRNRYNILTANGKLSLIIPICKSNSKTEIKDVKIDYSTNWQNLHWKSICTAYNSSPFFLYYKDDLYELFNTHYTYLLDYNIKGLDVLLEILEISKEIQKTKSYLNDYPNANDLRYKISPKLKTNSLYKSQSYNQVFINKHNFTSNLSIIDLIFNEGPDSCTYLGEIQ